MTPELFREIEYYLSAGCEWRIIVKLINRRMGTSYLSRDLQELYRRERKRREEERYERALQRLLFLSEQRD